MELDAEFKMLREEIGLLGPRSSKRRYPEELRARLVRWVAAKRSTGSETGEISDALGIPWATLAGWSRDAKPDHPTPTLRPVALGKDVSGSSSPARVVTGVVRRFPSGASPKPGSSSGQLLMHTPKGLTVEFPDVSTLVAVLERLG